LVTPCRRAQQSGVGKQLELCRQEHLVFLSRFLNQQEQMEIGNASMRAHGCVQAAGIAALQSWNDLASLKDVRAATHSGVLADLTDLGAQAG
jgi:hypothetical protein